MWNTNLFTSKGLILNAEINKSWYTKMTIEVYL